MPNFTAARFKASCSAFLIPISVLGRAGPDTFAGNAVNRDRHRDRNEISPICPDVLDGVRPVGGGSGPGYRRPCAIRHSRPSAVWPLRSVQPSRCFTSCGSSVFLSSRSVDEKLRILFWDSSAGFPLDLGRQRHFTGIFLFHFFISYSFKLTRRGFFCFGLSCAGSICRGIFRLLFAARGPAARLSFSFIFEAVSFNPGSVFLSRMANLTAIMCSHTNAGSFPGFFEFQAGTAHLPGLVPHDLITKAAAVNTRR